MTEDERKAIKERADAAQPAQWHHDKSELWGLVTTQPKGMGEAVAEVVRFGTGEEQIARGQFIAHARSDIPALLADIERLRGLIKDAEFAANEIGMGGIMEESICPWCSITEPPKRLLARSDVMHRNMAAYNRDPKRIAEPMPQIFSPHKVDCPAFTPEGVVK